MATFEASRLLTYEDYAALPADGKRYELVDGALVLMTGPNIRHQVILWNLSGALFNHMRQHPGGRVLFAPFDVVLDVHQVLQPDLLFVSDERKAVLTEANAQGAPDLVVEILSPGTMRRDRGRKRQLYAQYGVKELWIVHQSSRRVDVYRRGARGLLVRAIVVNSGGTLASPLLPGFELPLDELYESVATP